MSYKNLKDEIKIPEEDPFANDKLDRGKIADSLSAIIKTYIGPLVLSINGPWGFGKTTFIKMWRQKLKNDGHPCIYFNAWENDFSENSLFSFIGELNEFIKESGLKPKEKKSLETHIKKLVKTGGKTLRKSIPMVVRLASQGLIDFDKATEKEISSFLGSLAEEKILEYQEEKNTLKNFKENFSSFAHSLTFGEPTPFSSPLIVFVDELDRCKPTYAVELLETIKHFFSVHYVVFVLGVDRKQLSHSVRGLYGNDMDADGYLKRFINHEFTLPNPSLKNYCEYLFEYFKMNEFFDLRKTGSQFKEERVPFNYVLFNLVELLKLDLRTTGQVFSRLNIAIRQMADADYMFPECLAALAVIKSADEELYKRLFNREYFEEILDPITKKINKSPFSNGEEWQTIKVFVKCLGMTEDQISNKINSYIEATNRRAGHMFYLEAYKKFLHINRIHKSLFSKIEFCDSFK